jgi:hypothetical protein
VNNYGGKFRVMTLPGPGETLPLFQSDADWKKRYRPHWVQIEDKSAPAADLWLNSRARRSFERVDFLPGSDDSPPGIYNLWAGWHMPNAPTSCDRYLELVGDVIADGDVEVAEYVLNWMALRVQQPALKLETALVLRGGQGTGKSQFAERFGDLFGPYFVKVSGRAGIASNFNAHLQQGLLVFGDEMSAATDRDMIGRLKTLVTQTHLRIEPKGVDSFEVRNHFALIVASNEQQVVVADRDDRRWVVLDVSDARKGDYAFFRAVAEEWQSGGREALFKHLKARDLSSFEHRQRPKTDAHMEHVAASLSGAAKIVYALLSRGETPPVRRNGDDQPCLTEAGPAGVSVFVPTSNLIDWARREGLVQRDAGDMTTALGRELLKASPFEKATRVRVYGKQVRGVWLPSLTDARHRWAAETGLHVDWNGDESGRWDIDGAPHGENGRDEEVPF